MSRSSNGTLVALPAPLYPRGMAQAFAGRSRNQA
jgi:hypothetical protein